MKLDDAVHVDEETGLRFLPVVLNSHLTYTNEILGSDSIQGFRQQPA